MRLSAALLLALTACGHRYGADCDTGEDCRSGLCAYVTDPVCMGLKACTRICTEDGDCAVPGLGETRCLPDGVCAVPMPRGALCY